jgi:hypothetical protein
MLRKAGKNRFRTSILNEQAIIQDQHLIGMGHTFFDFMADEDDRMSLFLQAEQELEGRPGRAVIEVRKGFVEEDELRLHRQDSGDRQLSFFTAA